MSSSELKQKRLCSIEKFPNLKEFSEFLNSLNKAEVKHFTKMILEVCFTFNSVANDLLAGSFARIRSLNDLVLLGASGTILKNLSI